jgi:hypothetical protein
MNRETSTGCANWEGLGRLEMTRPIAVTAEDEREFQLAMDQYKRRSGRQFPTWSEVLEVLCSIGYAKRIWRPVGPWSPLLSTSIDNDPAGTVGWFARVETPVGP